LISEVPQVASIRGEWAVLAVAEIASRHDAEGADCCECANLRSAQTDVAVASPDTLALGTARQIEVACEHVADAEALAFARIAQPAATASAEFAITIVAVARSSLQRGSKSIDTSELFAEERERTA
jgi:hypothetical protein